MDQQNHIKNVIRLKQNTPVNLIYRDVCRAGEVMPSYFGIYDCQATVSQTNHFTHSSHQENENYRYSVSINF